MHFYDSDTKLGAFFADDEKLAEFVSTLKPEEFKPKLYVSTLYKIGDKIEQLFWEKLFTHISDKEAFEGSVFYIIMENFTASVNWKALAEDWVLDNVEPSWYA